MQKKSDSLERKKYLNKIKLTKVSIIITQITIPIMILLMAPMIHIMMIITVIMIMAAMIMMIIQEIGTIEKAEFLEMITIINMIPEGDLTHIIISIPVLSKTLIQEILTNTLQTIMRNSIKTI